MEQSGLRNVNVYVERAIWIAIMLTKVAVQLLSKHVMWWERNNE